MTEKHWHAGCEVTRWDETSEMRPTFIERFLTWRESKRNGTSQPTSRFISIEAVRKALADPRMKQLGRELAARSDARVAADIAAIHGDGVAPSPTSQILASSVSYDPNALIDDVAGQIKGGAGK